MSHAPLSPAQRAVSPPERSAQFERFEALFAEDLEDVHAAIDAHGTTYEQVVAAYFVITDSPLDMVHKDQLVAAVGGYHEGMAATDALRECADIHRSKDGNYQFWFIRATEEVAALCRKRRISLQKYRLFSDILTDFQDEVMDYFHRRHQKYTEPKRSLTTAKVEYTEQIQSTYYPGKPMESVDSWSDHVAARYVSVAQMEVMGMQRIQW